MPSLYRLLTGRATLRVLGIINVNQFADCGDVVDVLEEGNPVSSQPSQCQLHGLERPN